MSQESSRKNTPPPKRGRPLTRKMPPPIPDTPDNIMLALVHNPPKKSKEWAYLKNK